MKKSSWLNSPTIAKSVFLICFIFGFLIVTWQPNLAAANQTPGTNESTPQTILVGIDLPEGQYQPDSIIRPMQITNPNVLRQNTAPPQDSGHEENPLTIILDFNDPSQSNTTDIFANEITTFDVTAYGFAANQYDTVAEAILETVREHYFTILTSEQFAQSPLPPGKDLAIEVIIGDIGTPPSNGATAYYYMQIGTAVTGQCTSSLGCAGLNTIRNSNGGGGISNGAVVGSIFSNNINSMGGLSPSNALKSGNLNYTRHAIAGTTSHEIGHAASLLHLNKSGTVTPTGLPPLMGTGAIDLPNQDRIFDRDFAITGQNNQDGGATQTHIQQLMNAVNVHNSEDLGDAPDSYGTLRASDGARHLANGAYLGTSRDTESDSSILDNGSGDDVTNMDDEDGIFMDTVFYKNITDTSYTITVDASENAQIDAWIDFNKNGNFDHPSEHLNTGISFAVVAGENNINFILPASSNVGNTYGRFRISSDGNLSPTGWSADGEVEDYLVSITENDVPEVDAGDNQSVDEGDTVSFIGTFTNTVPLADNEEISWHFDDGTVIKSTLTPSQIYVDNGTFHPTLVITDSLGAAGSDQVMITVNNVPPTVTTGNNQLGKVGEPITVTATFSDPGKNDTHTAQINWGDGVIDSIPIDPGEYSLEASHTYTIEKTDTYPVMITVTDNDFDSGYTTLAIEVKHITNLYLPAIMN